MKQKGPEYYETQLPAIKLLHDHLGYDYLDGESPEFAAERTSEKEAVLIYRLEDALRRLNPGLPENGVSAAVRALTGQEGADLIDVNEKVHTMLSRWVTVEVEGKFGKEGYSVKFIEFDPEKADDNEFLIVEEFTVKGKQASRRADITVFVNGIPIVVIECKEPGDKHGLRKAYKQLEEYQRDEWTPKLFEACHVNIITKSDKARYGTVGADFKSFAPWPDPYPMTRDELFTALGHNPSEQDILLVGLLQKTNLLDMLRNFVAFDVEGGRKVKKIARYHQFQAVNETLAGIKGLKTKPAEAPAKDRGGVIWHTQGSGKSLTMLWLAVKLRREPALANPTILVITDRRDLDRQIHEKFRNCGFANPARAKSAGDLRKLLAGKGGQTIMTTVFKFRKSEAERLAKAPMPVLADAPDIFALVDEAHRSQYKNFAGWMKVAIPNLCRIAFTGTPLTKNEKTRSEFGEYIHKYTLKQAEADKVTVPIYYEARLPDLRIWGKKIDPLFDANFADHTAEQKTKIKQQELTEKNVALAEDRIEKIALDIFMHYKDHIEPNGFKAQVVASSHRAAFRYYNALKDKFGSRVALIISDPERSEADLVALHKQFKNNEKTIIAQFKYGRVDELAILIVVDKLLTGFDAPVEQAMYLDKPLRDHGLLQAIARVNRVGISEFEIKKTHGLVVDYWGVSSFLEKALENYDKEDLGEPLTQRDSETAFSELRRTHAQTLAFFDPDLGRASTEAWVATLEDDKVRESFNGAYREFAGKLDLWLPDTRALEFVDDAAWLEKVRNRAKSHYYIEDIDWAEVSVKVRKLIDHHVKTDDVVRLLAPVRITSDQFAEEIAKLDSAKAKTSKLAHALEYEINVNKTLDPVFYESVEARLRRIVSDWKNHRLQEIEALNKLFELSGEVKGRDSSIQAAFAGVLSEAAVDDADRIGETGAYAVNPTMGLAYKIVEALTPETTIIDWRHKQDVQREMRRKIKQNLREAGHPGDKINQTANDLMELIQARTAT